jgi:hypothetical protein
MSKDSDSDSGSEMSEDDNHPFMQWAIQRIHKSYESSEKELNEKEILHLLKKKISYHQRICDLMEKDDLLKALRDTATEYLTENSHLHVTEKIAMQHSISHYKEILREEIKRGTGADDDQTDVDDEVDASFDSQDSEEEEGSGEEDEEEEDEPKTLAYMDYPKSMYESAIKTLKKKQHH